MKAVKCVLLCLLISFLFTNVGFTAPGKTDKVVLFDAETIDLTQSEKEFIAEHPEIRLGVDPEFIPYEFIDSDGEYKGIAADYIDLICQKTGLKMTVAKDLIWSEAYEKAVERELDVLPCVSKTAEREKYFLFSDAYLTFQRVIFVNEDNKKITSLEDLYGKTVAVQTNSSHHSFLSSYDSITLSLYPTVDAALQAVSDGKEIAFVGNLTTSSYLLKSYGITNLKYISIDTEEPQSLYFAVRSDWPELVGIINKALAGIDEEEKIAINNKWIGIEKHVDYSEIIRIVGIIGAVIALILVVSSFWIIRLRKEITIRKKTQGELEIAKEEADRANQIKSLFLARMSHEIRTPLNAITGMAYLMKKTDVTRTQSIYLDKLTQAARNMLGILNDILDFSKIEAGKVEIERISFDLDKILQSVISIASAKVKEQNIEFVMEKDPDMPIFFWGDPTRIEQTLTNIVGNAIKFTEKGEVSLSVRGISRNENVYSVEFCVKDTGVGMNKEQIGRLFVPFDQGDDSISRRFGGTGLGLSIVKNLTDLMGGEINVESVEGQGSTFYIRLPLEADTGAEQMGSKKMAADCFHNVHALVLDKNANSNRLMDYFDSFGITAEQTSSEDDAIKRIRKATEEDAPFNLLMVDYMTPGDGGIEFLGRIKELSLFKPPQKYMLMIPLSREDLFDKITTAGVDFGITKPVLPSVLYNAIIELFQIIPPQAQKLSQVQDTPITAIPYHILLVEDNQTNQFIAQSILEQSGFRVSKADNGKKGFEFFADNRKDLDLILMDIHMPVMDGYAASDLIRKIDADIPIVAMTADAIAGVKEQCMSHGIHHYVSKPFEPEQLIKTILGVLKNRKSDDLQEPIQRHEDDGNTPVLDTADGIKRIGGDEKIYRMILKGFYDENSSVMTELEEVIDAKKYPEAIQIVHKLKSSSGNIGAKSIYEAASELQKLLATDEVEEIISKHRHFQSLFQKLMIEIENLLHD
jgi:signal transduction histidine kinase/CheY-like chemotaxis protein/HPt (histidine-containing phosphotransfer) domain-containing protein